MRSLEWGGVSGDAGVFDGISVALIADCACACASSGSSTRARSSFPGPRTAALALR